MENSRRSFFKKSLGAAGVFALPLEMIIEQLTASVHRAQNLSDEQVTSDESFWSTISQAFSVNPQMINLHNTGVSPQPLIVQEAVERYHRYSNEGPTYYMWQILDKGREPLRQKLADLAGCDPEEIAINRNATEALTTITYGLTLQKGDQVVMTLQDYPNMIHAWKQRELREGIKIKWINLPLPIDNEDVIVQGFISATTPQTKAWHITHMINWTGQVLPVKRLCEEARKRGIKSIVDAAHSFAHLDFKISDIQPDYLGASLHKWLCAPFGTGLLYVRKENIKNLYPLFPNDKPASDDIRKFEILGTRSFATEQAIGQAISFHHMIGSKRKEERLRYLKNYWAERLLQNKKVKLNVSLKPEFSCGIGNFSVEGIEPEKIVSRLMAEYQVHSTFTKIDNAIGVRVAPNVYTLTKDLDRFTNAVLKIIS